MAHSSEINPARFPVPASVRRMRSGRGDRGFTVLELLFAMAIIAILAGITLGVVAGVRQRVPIAQAKTEIAMLEAALEAFRSQYGDYPWIWTEDAVNPLPGSTVLYRALTGETGPLGPLASEGRRFADPDRSEFEAEAFLDPWGNPYAYGYRSEASADWKSPDFILMSAGPDGGIVGDSPFQTGLFTDAFRAAVDSEGESAISNRDNVYGSNR